MGISLSFAAQANATTALVVATRDVEYMSGMVYAGLVRALGLGSVSAWSGAKRPLFAPAAGAPRDPAKLYGRGFGYAGRLGADALADRCGARRADDLDARLLRRRLAAGAFDVVVVANGGDRCCAMDACYPGARAAVNDYLDRFPATRVATIDGNDLDACHTDFAAQLRGRVDAHFCREPAPDEWRSWRRPHGDKFTPPDVDGSS